MLSIFYKLDFIEVMSALVLILIGVPMGMIVNQAIHNHNKRVENRGSELMGDPSKEGWYFIGVDKSNLAKRLDVLNFLDQNGVLEDDIRIADEGIYYYNIKQISVQ